MKKFIKAIAYIFTILIAIELGVTYYVSGLAEQKFKEMERLLNDNQLISSEIVTYNRGLFKSEVTTHIKFKNLNLEKPIQVKHTIFNGPIIFTGINRNIFEFELALIKSVPAEMPPEIQIPFITNTVMHYCGDIESSTEGSLYKLQNQQLQMTGSKWSSKSIITKDLKGFKGTISFPESIIQSMGLSLSIKGVEIHFDQNRSSFGNWIGTVLLSVNNAVESKQGFELNNLKLEENSLLHDQLIDVAWKIELSKATFSNSTYGPVSLKMQVANLDPEGLRSLSENKANIAEDRSGNIFKSLLVKRPKITIENSLITLPQGVIHISAELSAGGSDIMTPINKEILEKTIDGNFLLVVPKEIFIQGLSVLLKAGIEKDPVYQKMDETQKKQALDQQVDLKITKLKKDGVLLENEKDYEIRLSISKGKWMVNDKEVSQPLS